MLKTCGWRGLTSPTHLCVSSVARCLLCPRWIWATATISTTSQSTCWQQRGPRRETPSQRSTCQFVIGSQTIPWTFSSAAEASVRLTFASASRWPRRRVKGSSRRCLWVYRFDWKRTNCCRRRASYEQDKNDRKTVCTYFNKFFFFFLNWFCDESLNQWRRTFSWMEIIDGLRRWHTFTGQIKRKQHACICVAIVLL